MDWCDKRMLNVGSFSRVNLVRERRSDELRVCKVIDLKDMDPHVLGMMRKEVQILSALDHPNIDEKRQELVLILEYVPGGDCIDLLEERDRLLPEELAARIVHQLLVVLNYCHSSGITHRDVKPENVMLSSLDDDAACKVIDFGLATPYKGKVKEFAGTVYLAPELAIAQAGFSMAADIWAVGVTAFELLAVARPGATVQTEAPSPRRDLGGDVAGLLLEAGANKDLADNGGCTSLMFAADEGHVQIVSLLLEAGANQDVADNYGCTALMRASIGGHVDVVRLLLEAGANKDVRDNGLADNGGCTSLMFAADEGYVELVSLLLDAGANKDLADGLCGTALMRASIRGHVDVVRLLLEAGANKDVTDNDGDAALKPASRNGHGEIVCLLLDAGANKDLTDKDGDTALMAASRKGHGEIVRLLLEAGAIQDVAGNYGCTALMRASIAHVDVVRLLLEAGAKKDVRDNGGCTSLMLAADEVEAGANKDLADNGGCTSLMLQAGASTDLKSIDSSTSLMTASGSGVSPFGKLQEYGNECDLILEKLCTYESFDEDLPVSDVCIPFGPDVFPGSDLLQVFRESPGHQRLWRSSEAKSFLRFVLAADPEDRPTAAQALDHPWLARYRPAPAPIEQEMLRTFADFAEAPQMHRSCLFALAAKGRHGELDMEAVEATFTDIDLDHDGKISLEDEMKRGAASDGTGYMGYTEFVAACLYQVYNSFDASLVDEVFDTLDHDRNGLLKADEVKHAFRRYPAGL
eukprot:s2709_g5.t1